MLTGCKCGQSNAPTPKYLSANTADNVLSLFSGTGNKVEIQGTLQKLREGQTQAKGDEAKFYRDAISLLEMIQSGNPNQEKMTDALISVIELGLRLFPDDLNYLLNAAQLLHQFALTTESLGHPEKSESLKQRAKEIVLQQLKKHPRSAEVYRQAANILDEKSLPERAAYLDMCLKLRPDDLRCKKQLRAFTKEYEEPFCSGQDLKVAFDFRAAYTQSKPGTKPITFREPNKKDKNLKKIYHVSDKSELTTEDILEARISKPEPYLLSNRSLIDVILKDEASERFENATQELVGNHFAIFINGKPHSAPVVNSAIDGGRMVVSMLKEKTSLRLTDICRKVTRRQIK